MTGDRTIRGCFGQQFKDPCYGHNPSRPGPAGPGTGTRHACARQRVSGPGPRKAKAFAALAYANTVPYGTHSVRRQSSTLGRLAYGRVDLAKQSARGSQLVCRHCWQPLRADPARAGSISLSPESVNPITPDVENPVHFKVNESMWQIVTATPFEHRPRLLDRAEGPGHAPTRQRPHQGMEDVTRLSSPQALADIRFSKPRRHAAMMQVVLLHRSMQLIIASPYSSQSIGKVPADGVQPHTSQS